MSGAFANICEVAARLSERLGGGPRVTAALEHAYARWDGQVFFDLPKGESISLRDLRPGTRRRARHLQRGETGMSNPVIFTCTWGREEPERATLPFVAANMAVAAGQDAIVLCTLEAVRLGTRGGSEIVAGARTVAFA